MTITNLADVAAQIQTYWSPMFTKELRESLLLGGQVNKDYEGEIKKGGDTVRVSQVIAPTGQLLTVGTKADSFSPEALSTTYVDIKADKRAVASFEFEDLVSLQSQIDMEGSEVRQAMLYSMNKQINDYLYSLVSPSTSSPDHLINSVSDFNAAQLVACRKLAGQAKWLRDKPWYCNVDSSYFADLLSATTLTSGDYGATDAPTISGQMALQRFGFNIFEDSSLDTDVAVLFHPDFLHLVMQSQVQVKVSDLHSQKRFGYVMSVDVIFGAKLGIDGAKKHIKVLAA
jgi:hypothetical protein